MQTTKEIAPHAIVKSIDEVHYTPLPNDYYLKIALLYASYGFKVFPVKPDKHPYKNFSWTKRASSNINEIIKMWQEYPNGRPAFYCQESGVVVIDTDNKPKKDDFGLLNNLVKELGVLPKTVLVYSQSNGTHMYYKLPKDRKLRRKVGNCIDIQTTAYCVCGGVQGDKGYYRFAEGYTLEDIGEIPELPEKWANYLTKEYKTISNENKKNLAKPKPIKIEGDFQKLYDNCLYIKMCVDEAHILNEEDWFRFAAILSNLENGFEIFDRCSQPHPEYCPEKTQAKFKNAEKYSFSCKTIAADFQNCKKCSHYKGENNYDKIK